MSSDQKALTIAGFCLALHTLAFLLALPLFNLLQQTPITFQGGLILIVLRLTQVARLAVAMPSDDAFVLQIGIENHPTRVAPLVPAATHTRS